MSNDRFWSRIPLDRMSEQQWESLCDGCGRCCLHKLEDEETGELFFTQIACKLLDIGTCRCGDYANRSERVPECLNLRQDFTQFHWLPFTCAYRLLAQGEELPVWHPLVSGRADSVRDAGISIHDLAVPEDEADLDRIEDYVIEDLK